MEKVRKNKVNGLTSQKQKGFKTWGKLYEDYLKNRIKLKRYQIVGIMMLIIVIAGFVGWVYEFFVALIEEGEVYMKGGNLLPWMNIYAIGAILIVPLTYKLKRWPWAVFLVAVVVTGLVELIGGWLVYTIGNGTRYWNYDHGLWAWGSINGFVCPLSVTFFGIGALLLMYLVVPACVFLAERMSKRAFLTLAISLFAIVMVDEVTNLVLKNLNQPTAMDFYRGLGMKYQEF